ncbi:DMP19 family protein [Paenibacillus sp. CAU 1782]
MSHTGLAECLVTLQTARHGTAEDIVNEVCRNLYEARGQEAMGHFRELPEVLQDIILLIELDTELSVNGITGFLENGTGRYLDETIDCLRRIGALEDYEALSAIKIKARLQPNGVTEAASLHEHDLCDIVETAERLYLYQGRDLFGDFLYRHVQCNRNNLMRGEAV